jgi:hypothetical protein
MSRKKAEENMSIAELKKRLTPEDAEFVELVRIGRQDPVAFGEKILCLEFHPGQKVWLWLSSQALLNTKGRAACLEAAFTEGLTINLWADRAEFELRTKDADFMKNILVPSNRWGKTFVTSAKHIWVNFYKKGVRGAPKEIAMTECGTLNLSPHSKQCTAGHAYVEQIVQGRFAWVGADGVSRSNEKCRIKNFFVRSVKATRTIYFKNLTSYQAVPTGEDQASSLAGTKYLYISYDEAAQSLHLKAELPAKIMSRLIDFGGPLDLVSTPEVDKPSHQYFFRVSKLGLLGREGWFTLVGKLTDNVFLGKDESEKVIETIRTTDPAKYRQVAFGEFVTTGQKMFDALVIERIWETSAPRSPEVDHKYAIGADWGFSDTGDPTVFYVVDWTQAPNWKQGEQLRYRIVFREAIRGGSPFAVLARAKMLQREWLGAIFVHDSAAMGGTIIGKALRELEMTNVVDFNASGGNKADLLFALIMVLTAGRRTETLADGKTMELNPDFGRLRGYMVPELEEQLGNYQYNPEKGVTDKKLEQDDIMALGMALWYLERKMGRAPSKPIGFNPLAPTVSTVFPGKDRASVAMRSIDIKERVIN